MLDLCEGGGRCRKNGIRLVVKGREEGELQTLIGWTGKAVAAWLAALLSEGSRGVG